MSVSSDNSAPHGMKAIRHIRGHTGPSERQKKRVKETYEYFLEKVDPIIGECITHMLCEQPDDILSAMTTFLVNFESNTGRTDKNAVNSSNLKARKELKLYLATSIGPIISKLVNRIAAVQPENVIEFMCQELASMKDEDSLNPDAPEVVSSPSTATDAGLVLPILPQTSTNQQVQNNASPGIATDKAPAAPESRNIQIAIVGLGGSGKSSVINSLTGTFDQKIRPTIGFRPFSLMLGADKVRFYDLGGGEKIRGIWDQYFHDVHGIIYVVDASAPLSAEAAESHEARELFRNTVQHDFLDGKPVLVLANKQDAPTALSREQITAALQLDAYLQPTQYTVAECSALIPDQVTESFAADPRIEAALEGLLGAILERYAAIDAKVQVDVKLKAQEEARKRIERERKVLKSKIASAFIHELSPETVAALGTEEDLQNVFSEEEGLNFLAAEIGEEPSRLADIAVEVARLVGYQRLALQIIGALKAPISKKKVPMQWEDICALVKELRQELQL